MANATTTVKIKAEVQRWDGEHFLLHLDVQAESELAGIAPDDRIERVMALLTESLQNSVSDQLRKETPADEQIKHSVTAERG